MDAMTKTKAVNRPNSQAAKDELTYIGATLRNNMTCRGEWPG